MDEEKITIDSDYVKDRFRKPYTRKTLTDLYCNHTDVTKPPRASYYARGGFLYEKVCGHTGGTSDYCRRICDACKRRFRDSIEATARAVAVNVVAIKINESLEKGFYDENLENLSLK